jgi:hypothetical protein
MSKMTSVNLTSPISNLKLLASEESKERMESMNFQTLGAILRLLSTKIRVQKETKVSLM